MSNQEQQTKPDGGASVSTDGLGADAPKTGSNFRELRDRVIEADNQAIADWEERENNWMRGPPSIEERLSFVEFRRSMLAGAIGAILSELIARDERDTEAHNAEFRRGEALACNAGLAGREGE